MKFRKEKSLLPAIYAEKGDFILLRDEIDTLNISSLPFYNKLEEKNIKPITLNEIPKINKDLSKVLPWGWDHSIYQTLLDNGTSFKFLPSAERIDNIRKLSHRRTTIPFREFIASFLKEEIINLPKELKTIKEVEGFLRINPITYFKAPWSSSGRGIIVSDHISEKGLLEWCHGIIRRQGSVIAEKAWNRNFDFATEWIIENEEPCFLGYSIFETSSRGKYHGNVEDSQKKLFNKIKERIPNFSKNILKAQHTALKRFISPFYDGYLGIDMLADLEGKINPCVELNLRLTMGHISLFENP